MKKIVLMAALMAGSAAMADTYQCVQCQNGTYANNGTCAACPSGKYCVGGQQYACPAGYNCAAAGLAAPLAPVSASTDTSGVNCTRRQFFNGKTCVNCSEGFFSFGGQSTSCTISCQNYPTSDMGPLANMLNLQECRMIYNIPENTCAACPASKPYIFDGKCCDIKYLQHTSPGPHSLPTDYWYIKLSECINL